MCLHDNIKVYKNLKVNIWLNVIIVIFKLLNLPYVLVRKVVKYDDFDRKKCASKKY